MNYLGIDYSVKNMPALDPGFIPFGVWAKAYLQEADRPFKIAVERENGLVTIYETKLRGPAFAEANYRYIYLPRGYITCGDDLYLPLDAIGRIFSLTGALTDAGTVELSTEQVRMISGSEDYYATHFSADELYWLPHIAYVEALDEPLRDLMSALHRMIERTPPELASDIFDEGITLSGGGAQLFGLDGVISDQLKIRTTLADEPDLCVAHGLSELIDDEERYENIDLVSGSRSDLLGDD